MDKIISYLLKKYDPVSIILYGSCADGTNDENSDFDALVITGNGEKTHDTSFVDGVRLDVFVYPASAFDGQFDCEEILQADGGKLILDKSGIGKTLLENIRKHIESIPPRTREEKQSDVDWCRKMLLRAKRNYAEGNYRRHWLITDSPEIWCGLIGKPYLGPKKTLRYMEENCAEAFEKYSAALNDTNGKALEEWVNYLDSLI